MTTITDYSQKDLPQNIRDMLDAAKRLQPPDRAGHRRIDKAIAALKAELGVSDTIYDLRRRNP